MSRRVVTAVTLAAATAAAAGIAYAAIPDAEGVIHGCRHQTTGQLRVIDSGQSCGPAETPLDWVQSAGFEVFRSLGFSPAVEITAVRPAPAQPVMSLELPPGSYAISTLVDVQKASGDGVVTCFTFTAPGFVTSAFRAAMGTAPGDSRWLTMGGTGLFAFPNGGTAELRCRQLEGAVGANPLVVEADISAVRIGTITQAEDEG